MNETELWMMRTDMRLHMQEVLLLRLQLMVLVVTGKVRSVDAALRETCDVLDQLAKEADQIFATDSNTPALNNAQRAQSADEMRELIEDLRKQATLLASGMTVNTA
jgi:hypothetical protein